jgi:hypothetical protein
MEKTITLSETDMQLLADYKQAVENEREAFKKSCQLFHNGEHEEFLEAHTDLNKALAHLAGSARIIAARLSVHVEA